jgi:hypothetical protein
MILPDFVDWQWLLTLPAAMPRMPVYAAVHQLSSLYNYRVSKPRELSFAHKLVVGFLITSVPAAPHTNMRC